jgi:hypothetical protein
MICVGEWSLPDPIQEINHELNLEFNLKSKVIIDRCFENLI